MCKLYSENERLVPYVFNKYFKSWQGMKEDLMQEGYMELWRVANNAEDRSSSAFTTYAITCIRGKMRWYLNKNDTCIKPSEDLIKAKCKATKKYGNLSELPTDIDRVATELGINRDLAQGLCIAQEGTISLDTEVKGADKETSIADIYCLVSEPGYKEVEDNMMLEQFVKGIEKDRDKVIFLEVLRGLSYTDIAKKVNISYRQVGRVAKKICEEYLLFMQ